MSAQDAETIEPTAVEGPAPVDRVQALRLGRRDIALEPRRAAVILAGAIGFLGLVGAVHAARPTWFLVPFDLDGERNVPALFSALLLIGGGVALFRLSLGAAGALFSMLLVYGALDEAAQIHETLERRLGLDWQLLYLPVFAGAAILWYLVFLRLPRGSVSKRFLVAGATAWIGAQALEFAQWDGDRPRSAYRALMVPEEVLEMAGSAVILVGLLFAANSRATLRCEQASNHQPPAR